MKILNADSKKYILITVACLLLAMLATVFVLKPFRRPDLGHAVIIDGSKYPGSPLGDYALPPAGEYLLSDGVKAALKDPENNGSYYFVSILFMANSADKHEQDEEQNEMKRLKARGLYISAYDVWSFGEGESVKAAGNNTVPFLLTGLLTEKQLCSFPVLKNYSYIIDWAYGTDNRFPVPDLVELSEYF